MDREHIPTQSLGIDLASQPRETGICLIDWSHGVGQVVSLESGALDDDRLVGLMLGPDIAKVGIDAPFGWPLGFIDAVATFRDTGVWLDLEANELRFRATETRTAREVGQQPLSAAMSDLAWPTMRCARLLSRLAGEHGVLDRTGRGLAAEVYPMAALRRWGVIDENAAPSEWSYKGSAPERRERREAYVAKLLERLDGSVEADSAFLDQCIADDDDLDAFVSALVARAAALSLTDPIPVGDGWRALREGWIHLPRAEAIGQLAVG